MGDLSIVHNARRVLLAAAVAFGVLGASISAATASGATPRTQAPPAAATHASTNRSAVSATAPLTQVSALTSTSGLTVVWLPNQVATGGHLAVTIRTVPGAHVTFTLGFPDGTTLTAHRRAGAGGYASVQTLISYQPQGSAEDATVTVMTVLPAAGLHDTVTGNVTVLQRIALSATLKAPKVATVGRQIAVTVVASEPGALVRLRLTYPDGAVESLRGGYTSANGVYIRRFAVSRSDGVRGYLTIQAIVSYDGVQLSRTRRVALRAHTP
jgi:hypothetical protein